MWDIVTITLSPADRRCGPGRVSVFAPASGVRLALPTAIKGRAVQSRFRRRYEAGGFLVGAFE